MKTKTRIQKTPGKNNYFYGKLLNPDDLNKEQDYFQQKRWPGSKKKLKKNGDD
jgi:hypothetical protein